MGRFFENGYGFVPWSAGGMQGWYRQTAFVKDCLAGEIARYYADDYIVIRHEGDRSVNLAAGTLAEQGRRYDAQVSAVGLP